MIHGHVYGIRRFGTNLLKVGCTTRPLARRVSELRISEGTMALFVEWAIPVPWVPRMTRPDLRVAGPRPGATNLLGAVERDLHAELSPVLDHDEWFTLSVDDSRNVRCRALEIRDWYLRLFAPGGVLHEVAA